MPPANPPPCKSEHAGSVKLTKHQRVVHDYPPPRALQSFRAKLPDPLNPRTSLDAKRVPTALDLFASSAITVGGILSPIPAAAA
jgi:hypothetical protein